MTGFLVITLKLSLKPQKMKRKLTLLIILLFAMMMHLQAMQISVTNPTTGTFTLDVEPGDDILGVKAKIFDIQNIAIPMMTLKYGTTLLADANTLSFYSIGSGATLALILPSGTGTSADPYQIATLDNLYWLSQTPSVWADGFAQTADIDAAATSTWDGGKGFKSIGLAYGIGPAFGGTYDGKGYAISNLYINRPTLVGVGLFGYSEGELFNIRIIDATVIGHDHVGVLAGLGYYIKNCSATGHATASHGYVGGLVGSLDGKYMKFCSANVHVTNTGPSGQYIGGLIGRGYNNMPLIKNCYAQGEVSGVGAKAGGLIGELISGCSVYNSYSTGAVTLVGTEVGGMIGNFNDTGNGGTFPPIVSSCFWDMQTSGKSTSAGAETGKTTAEMQTQTTFTAAGWNFDLFWSITGSNYPLLDLRPPTYSGGSGLLADPFQIATLNNLVQLSLWDGHWDKYFIQTAHIDASPTAPPTQSITLNPIGGEDNINFSGTYDGNNFTIDQLYQNRADGKPLGLFGITDGATLKNIHLTNVQIMGSLYVGGLVGMTSLSEFSNCHVTGAVNAVLLAGGFVGYSSNTTFTKCRANVAVTGLDMYGPEMMTHLGGFAGNVNFTSSFTDCYARGAVSGYQVGGFIGGVDENSATAFGGAAIDPTMGFTLTNCYSANTLTGTVVNGGLYGQSTYTGSAITITNSFWDKDLAGTTDGFVGGIGKTTAEMKTLSTFTDAGWDFTTTPIWNINAIHNNGYPYLAFEPYPSTWDGSESTAWNTPANWSNNAVPTATDNVLVPNVANAPVIASGVGASCNNLTVNGDASLTVQSSGSLITKGTVSGNVTIQREVTGSSTLTANKYHLVSVPLATSNNSLSGLFTGSYLYGYLPVTNVWSGMGTSTTTALDETVGYMAYYPNASTTYSFTGTLNTGPFTPTVTYPGNAVEVGNFALVPNPYPSNIDWNAVTGWTKTNIGTSIWVYNNGNYGVWDGTNTTNGGSRYISVGQAFFVQTTASVPSLIMDNNVRTHTAATFLKNSQTITDQLRVKADANTMADELLVGFGETNSNEYNPNEDAVKFYGSEDAPQIYTKVGENKVTINALGSLSDVAIVPLNFETKYTGAVNLSFTNIESFDPSINIYLKDELANQTINLRNQSVYTFNHIAANDANRFKLIFGGTYGIDESDNLAGNMWINGNTLYINALKLAGEKATVKVYNAAGQSLLAKKLVVDGLTTLDLNMQGFVIVKCTSGQTVLTAKGILIK
jgi:hypothetical protein